MATYKGVNKTIADAPTPSTIIAKGEMGGNVRVMYDSYTVPTTPLATTDDVIELCGELPLNSRVLDIIIYNGVTSHTFTLGDYEDPARYNASVANGAVERIDVVGLNGYKVDMTTASTPDNQITITIVGGTLTAADVIEIVVFYTTE